MNISFGILAILMFLLLFAEKDDCKRKHLTWGFIAVIGAMTVVNVFALIF